MSDREAPRKTPSFEWALWFEWVLVSTLGWLFGWLFLPQLAIGVVVGVLQWLFLRRRVPQAGWWILATAAAWAIGQAVAMTLLPQVGFLVGAVLGASTGIAQWFLLQRWVHRAGWWIVMSTLGWALGLTGFLGFSLVGAVAGGVTGLALELMLRYTRPKATTEPTDTP